MNQTNGDSKFDIVFMSFGKEKEKGIQVEAAGEKDNILQENMLIHTNNSKILENGTWIAENGAIVQQNANFAQVKQNNEKRITDFAIEQAKRKGKMKELNKEKAKRKAQEDIQELA